MAYWKNLTDAQIQGLAEAAISDSFHVVTEARRRQHSADPLRSSDASYIQARKNLHALIANVPDSDILRAEGLAFRLVDLCKFARRPNDTDLRNAYLALEAVQASPAYLTIAAAHSRT